MLERLGEMVSVMICASVKRVCDRGMSVPGLIGKAGKQAALMLSRKHSPGIKLKQVGCSASSTEVGCLVTSGRSGTSVILQ